MPQMNISLQYSKNILIYFVLFVVMTMVFRLFTSEILYPSGDLGYVASFAFMFALIIALWNFDYTHLGVCLSFILFYVLSAYIKRQYSMVLPEREITHTIGVAIILFAGVSLVYNMALRVKNAKIQKTLKMLAYVADVLFLLPPLLVLGYALVNKSIFSTDIMLTLFQTNWDEIKSYLSDKNWFLWLIGTLVIILILYIHLRKLQKIKHYAPKPIFVFSTLWLGYIGLCIMPKLNLCFLNNVVQTTYATIQSFDDFKQQIQIRNDNLQKLTIKPEQQAGRGLYVLVIGESATRNHLNAYGYTRPTTPWLNEFSQNPHTVIFSKAYSNHVHTVPTLTYALSEQNQYNKIELTQAYSLIELAKAFGYETLWLSNQPRYSLCDTPITIMGAMADKAVWLNTNTGEKLSVTYYDEKLAEYISSFKQNKKALIIVHLMGSHGAYRDRYPPQFARFKSQNRRIDAYDNSILYTDEVLHLIYEAAAQNPNFMAMVYLSDHGEDPDNGLGHESSRFSLSMAEIPFFVHLSPLYTSLHQNHLRILQNNKDKIWTNDLLFDFMLSLMDIDFRNRVENKYNILSSHYGLKADEVKLLHGQKNLN